jgi:Peptidase C10 family/Spi protease inhibitor/CUB domain/Secretion system C-terminal sorting domain
MKKFTLILCFTGMFFAFALDGFSKKIEKAEALKVGQNFLYEKTMRFSTAKEYNAIVLNEAYVHSQNDETYFYAFNQDNGGFVIVSAQDQTEPIIGYAFEGSFPSSLDLNSNYGRFLQTYIDQINYAILNKVQPSEASIESWNSLLSEDFSNQEITAARDRSVEPLVSSMWNQNSPYNALCPEDDMGPGGHVYAGCVATAMSQVMHYWRFPLTGTDSHGYSSNYGWLEADFGATDYDWTGMLNKIDANDPWGIAQLQSHAGIAIDMQYSPDGSGAWLWDAFDAMKDYFKYPTCEYLDREDFTTGEWKTMVIEELDNARPLVYVGYSEGGGHAFVCDGYQDDDFHFNFGWGGSSNGFYSIDDVNGYSYWQQCLRNVVPLETEYPNYVNSFIEINRMSGSFTDGSGPVADYLDNTSASWLINPQTAGDSVTAIAMEFSKFELGTNDVLNIYDGGTTSAPLLGTYSDGNSPGTFTSTSNKVLVVFESDASGTGPGFYAEFEAILPDYCSGFVTITEESGTFNDGSEDFNYNNNSLCFWKIEPESKDPITLVFNAFSTEQSSDFINVYDNQTLLGTYSGTDIPAPIVAESGIVMIAFKSNKYNTGNGWEISYQTNPVGIENKSFDNIQVFPNPVSKGHEITVDLGSSEFSAATQIELLDLSGRVLKNIKISGEALIFDAPENPGLYFIRIKEAGNKSLIKKLMVCN